jgi:hypothetical protein
LHKELTKRILDISANAYIRAWLHHAVQIDGTISLRMPGVITDNQVSRHIPMVMFLEPEINERPIIATA